MDRSFTPSVWPPLPQHDNGRFIRLLHVDASTKPIRCTSTVHALDDVPQFCALSYCWGENKESDWIYCNNVRLPVRANLYSFLSHVRGGPESFLLWIDAICINQADNAEKERQVGLMGEIYSAAAVTMIWLGPAPPEQTRVIHYIELLSKAFEEHRTTKFDNDVNKSMGRLSEKDLVEIGLPPWKPGKEPLLQPLYDFFHLDWWKRAWIIQEFALSNRPVLVQGGKTFDWEAVLRAYTALDAVNGWTGWNDVSKDSHNRNRVSTIGSTRYACISQTEHIPDSKRVWNLFGILSMHQEALCADPRDKVFCMLGVLRKLHPELKLQDHLKPDYSSPLEVLYRKVALEVLRTSDHLDLLSFLRPSDLPSKDLPSWVPDFSTTRQVPGLFRASTQLYEWAASTSPLDYSVSGDTLRLSGHVIDEITHVSGFIADIGALMEEYSGPFRDAPYKIRELVAAVLDSRDKICSRDGDYLTGCSAKEAFYSTTHLLAPENVDVRNACDDPELEVRECYVYLHTNAGPNNSTVDSQYGFTEAYSQQVTLQKVLEGWGLCFSLKMARTRLGYYCNVPCQTEVGDSIVLCAGGTTPLVARRIDKPGQRRHAMLGGCYVHGIMFGEAWKPELAADIWFE